MSELKRITIRLDSELTRDMDNYVKEDKDITPSQIIRKALRRFFEKQKNDPASGS